MLLFLELIYISAKIRSLDIPVRKQVFGLPFKDDPAGLEHITSVRDL